MSRISIVIPTYNEKGYIAQLLTSIVAQTVQPDQVIIVDCGSQDGTAQEIGKFMHVLPLVCLTSPRGIGRQRNIGAKLGTSNLLLFLDADVILSPRFLQVAVTEFKQRQLDTACTYTRIDPGRPAFDRFGARLLGVYQSAFQFSCNPFGTGYCTLTTKQWHNKINGYNETYKHGEDHDYVKRAVQSGAYFRFLNTPGLIVSDRRYEEYGRFSLLGVYMKAELNRLLFDYKYTPREEPLYDFGKFRRQHYAAAARQ